MIVKRKSHYFKSDFIFQNTIISLVYPRCEWNICAVNPITFKVGLKRKSSKSSSLGFQTKWLSRKDIIFLSIVFDLVSKCRLVCKKCCDLSRLSLLLCCEKFWSRFLISFAHIQILAKSIKVIWEVYCVLLLLKTFAQITI